MSNLRATISALANQFADGVLRAVQAASLSELSSLQRSAPTPARRGPAPSRSTSPATRLPKATPGARRSARDFEKLAAAIVSVVAEAGAKGLRSEQIQRALGLAKKDVVRPIQLALDSKQLKKKGQRRGTTYFAA